MWFKRQSNPPPENQLVPLESQEKKNSKSTSSSDSSIAAVVLQQMLLKNQFLAQKLASPTRNTWEAFQGVSIHLKAPEHVCYPCKVLTIVHIKFFDLMQLYIGPNNGK